MIQNLWGCTLFTGQENYIIDLLLSLRIVELQVINILIFYQTQISFFFANLKQMSYSLSPKRFMFLLSNKTSRFAAPAASIVLDLCSPSCISILQSSVKIRFTKVLFHVTVGCYLFSFQWCVSEVSQINDLIWKEMKFRVGS